MISPFFELSRPCLLDHRSHDLRHISSLLQSLNDLVLVIGSETLKCNTKFHSRIAVCGYELVVLKLDNVTLLIGKTICNLCKLARLIRKKYGYCKDTISEDQSLLHNR